MFDQPPFPESARSVEIPPRTGSDEVGVIVPTRDRPGRLTRCLEALAAAREHAEFRVYVCDSSAGANADAVVEACAKYEFIELVRHDRVGAAAARNVGTEACDARLIVTVDDDVYVEPGAVAALRDAYRACSGECVVAGSVVWGEWASQPIVMRAIGFGRVARSGEEPDFLISALLLYPRELGLRFPWNERLWPYDDRYASLIWRAAGAELAFEPGAVAHHDPRESDYRVVHEADRVYVNALDAVCVSRSVRKVLAYELLSFAAAAKKWARTPRGAWQLITAWTSGHLALLRDRRELRRALHDARALRAGARP